MSEPLKPAKPGRLISLDAFRGMTIAGMILVNNAGDWSNQYKPLGHAAWHGCTATDLIFPFFLFIMGVAMTFSFSHRLEEPGGRRALLGQVLRRTLLLFGLGMLLNLIAYVAAPWVESLRIPGVLQRIALCYLVVSLIGLRTQVRGQALWTIGLLGGYWAAMKFIPVPGHGAGILDKVGNLASYLDTQIFGITNYEFDTVKGIGHDPEGLLSTLPAIATTLTGLLAGQWIRRKDRDGNEKTAGLATAALVLLVLGALWHYEFPYNKNLWTSSYVLHTSGWGLLTFAACYWVIDVKGRSAWTKPFVVYGTNAIAAYFGASAMAWLTILIRIPQGEGKSIFLKTWLYDNLFKSWIPGLFGDKASSAAYGIMYVLIWLGLMGILYRKKIFIKV